MGLYTRWAYTRGYTIYVGVVNNINQCTLIADIIAVAFLSKEQNFYLLKMIKVENKKAKASKGKSSDI